MMVVDGDTRWFRRTTGPILEEVVGRRAQRFRFAVEATLELGLERKSCALTGWEGVVVVAVW